MGRISKVVGKRHARDGINNAIKAGQVKRPVWCQQCHTKPQAGTEAHHSKHDRALRVRFLCKPCHVKADKAHRRGKGIK